MAAQIFLATPPTADAASFPTLLAQVLAAADISALLVLRHGLAETSYAALIAALLPIAQPAGCAVLVDNDAALAITLGADGVHLAPDVKAVKAAIASLKPDSIVGVGPLANRHDAMTMGELDVDYLLFGALDAAATPMAAELANWWAETFEIPAVLVAAQGGADGVEFLAPEPNVWANAPEQVIAAFAGALRP